MIVFKIVLLVIVLLAARELLKWVIGTYRLKAIEDSLAELHEKVDKLLDKPL